MEGRIISSTPMDKSWSIVLHVEPDMMPTYHLTSKKPTTGYNGSAYTLIEDQNVRVGIKHYSLKVSIYTLFPHPVVLFLHTPIPSRSIYTYTVTIPYPIVPQNKSSSPNLSLYIPSAIMGNINL